MKLFFKHFFRSFCRAPWQPFFILLTLTLSVSVSVTAFCFQDIFSDFDASVSEQNSKLGDVLVSLSGDAEVRLLFTEDLQSIVGARGEIFGEYELTVFYRDANEKNHMLSASAADPVAADRYFQFVYTEYGSFTTQNLSSSVIVSETFAKNYGFAVGDALTFRLLDADVTYTVQAVAQADGFFDTYDILLPISGVVQLLAERVPAVASLGDGFAPYNRLMVRLEPTADREALLSELMSDPLFADKQIERTDRTDQAAFALFTELTAMRFLTLLVLILCGILIATSLRLLQKQRNSEYALFCSVGASRAQLIGMQVMESLLYAVCGSVLGLLLSPAFLRTACSWFGWEYNSQYFETAGVAFGFFISCFLILLCTAFDILRSREMPLAERLNEKTQIVPAAHRGRKLLLPLISCTVFFTVLLPMPVSGRLIPAVALFLSLVWLLYTLFPILLSWLAKIAEKPLEKQKSPPTVLLLAIKNLRYHAALQHVGRLLSVLLALFMVVSLCGTVLGGQIDALEHVVTGELIALNVPEEAEARLREDSAVAGCARFDFASGSLVAGHSVIALMASGDVEQCIQPAFLPQNVPASGEVSVSAGIAALGGMHTGDAVTVVVKGVSQTLTVSEIQQVNSNFIFLNADDMTAARDLLCIRFTDAAAQDADEQARVIALLEDYGVIFLDSEEILGTLQIVLKGFFQLLLHTVLISAVLTLVGIGNALSAQYHARKQERGQLFLCGMRRGQLLLMYGAELLLLVLASAALSAVFGQLLCRALNCAIYSFGIALFF